MKVVCKYEDKYKKVKNVKASIIVLPLFKKLKLLKVNDILKPQELQFYYEFKNNKLPHYLQSLAFYTNIETHNYATRIQHNIQQHTCKHTFAKNCVHFQYTHNRK